MAVTDQEKLRVLGKLYPYAPRRIVDGVLEVGTEDGTANSPQVNVIGIDFQAEIDTIYLEEAKIRKKSTFDKKRIEIVDGGMLWDFPGNVQDIVQTRERDKIVLLGLNNIALSLINSGVTDPVLSFRGKSDIEHQITPQQAYGLTMEAGLFVEGIYKTSWYYKDLVDAATSIAEVEAINWN